MSLWWHSVDNRSINTEQGDCFFANCRPSTVKQPSHQEQERETIWKSLQWSIQSNRLKIQFRFPSPSLYHPKYSAVEEQEQQEQSFWLTRCGSRSGGSEHNNLLSAIKEKYWKTIKNKSKKKRKMGKIIILIIYSALIASGPTSKDWFGVPMMMFSTRESAKGGVLWWRRRGRRRRRTRWLCWWQRLNRI